MSSPERPSAELPQPIQIEVSQEADNCWAARLIMVAGPGPLHRSETWYEAVEALALSVVAVHGRTRPVIPEQDAEQLREALRSIRDADQLRPSVMVEIARAALKGKEKLDG